jgi:hypothetical protein
MTFAAGPFGQGQIEFVGMRHKPANADGLRLHSIHVLFDSARVPFLCKGVLRVFDDAALRRLTSSGEYMVPRQARAPQLQMASSPPPS